MQRHFRLGVLLGVVSFFALTSAQVFAVDATSGTSDTIGQRVPPAVSHAKEPVLAGSASIPGIPEPGVVAFLGFGLLVLGFSFVLERRVQESQSPQGQVGRGVRNLRHTDPR